MAQPHGDTSRSGRRRWARPAAVAGGAAAALLLIADGSAAAQADEPPNAIGPCTAQAVLSNGTSVDPYASSGPYVIPRSGSADYEGTVGVEATEREFSGQVVIKTPPFIPDIELADAWTWEGTGSGVSDSGTVTWDLPDALPSGVPVTVEGFHQDAGVRCEGSVTVEVEGGLWDSPITPAALGGTALALAGVGVSMIPRRGGAA